MKKIRYEKFEKNTAKYITDLQKPENIVAEKQAPYGNRPKFLTPFIEREDLLPREKTAVGNYQDVWQWNSQKEDWGFEVPENWKKKSWCYAINNYCRNQDFKNKITREDREDIEFNIQNIDNAILKSETDREYTLFKGLGNADWLSKIKMEETYVEKAFGSYSLKMEQALGYADPDYPVLFQVKIEKKSKALYIDDAEDEVLLPRNMIIKIKGIVKTILPITLIINNRKIKQTIVYNIEMMENKDEQ